MSIEERPPQSQSRQPGLQSEMQPQPQTEPLLLPGRGSLEGKVALITGGDSGIGRAVAFAFAREGADVAIVYLNEHKDADETRALVTEEGRRCVTIAGDVGDESFAQQAVARTVVELGKLDILINNASEQHPQERLEDISAEQLERTFRTNIFGMFFMAKAALPYLNEGAAIVNTASVTAYKGSPKLVDYSATKGAIVAFTRSLALQVAPRGIRVNAVAPGPVWTPLIAATYPPDEIPEFGKDTPLGRAGEPAEIAPAFVFLAGPGGTYISGQTIHVNGGTPING